MAKPSVQTFGEWVESNARAPVFGSKTAVRKWLLVQLGEAPHRIAITENAIRSHEEGRHFPRQHLVEALMVITSLPMESFRAWRQTDTAAVPVDPDGEAV